MNSSVDRVTIVPYRGFGKNGKIYISGHAFRGYGIQPPERGSVIKNFIQMTRRYSLKPMGGLKLSLNIFNRVETIHTDDNGFFRAILPIKANPGVYRYSVSNSHNNESFSSGLYVYDEDSTGVLSDIDDTILLSYVHQKYKMLWLLIAKNALTRNPVPQIKGILNTIKTHNNSISPHDFFYVSNSEWNLYDFLVDFFKENDLPDGVFMLQRFKKNFRDAVFSSQKKDDHKFDSIRFILNLFTEKKFILVGDNGQRDLETYARITNLFAKRIKAVVIRDIGLAKYRRKNKEYEQQIHDLNIPVDHISSRL
ncbi:MAG: phosphatase domain-containing protein [Bacteroidota bacterium]